MKRYNNDFKKLFGKVSTALSSFEATNQLYDQVRHHRPEIASVIASFAKLCARVTNYRQGTRCEPFKGQFDSIFDSDTEPRAKMTKFEDAVNQKHNAKGRITLASLEDTRHTTIQTLRRISQFFRED